MLRCARVGSSGAPKGLLRYPHFHKQAEYPLELFLEDLSVGRDAATEAFVCAPELTAHNEPSP